MLLSWMALVLYNGCDVSETLLFGSTAYPYLGQPELEKDSNRAALDTGWLGKMSLYKRMGQTGEIDVISSQVSQHGRIAMILSEWYARAGVCRSKMTPLMIQLPGLVQRKSLRGV